LRGDRRSRTNSRTRFALLFFLVPVICFTLFVGDAFADGITWYFAEGYTGPGFQEYLCLQNPNDAAANVTIEYRFRSGGGKTQNLTIGPNTRETVDVNGVVGPNQEVSTKVSADQVIIAERPMYFKFGGINGGHDVVGATAPAYEWYFAEGYTGAGFQEWLTLQNPNDVPANVTITYDFRSGGGAVQNLTIGANTRQTVDVNAAVGPNQEVSATVSADQLIVAERPMYFNFNGINGGHDVVGAYYPDYEWYFAEGYTGTGFQEWLTLQNPNGVAADVLIAYQFRNGTEKVEEITIGPYTRETVDVNAAVGANQEVSTIVMTDETTPIIAERPMYFNSHGINDGHDVVGTNVPYDYWYFAEGYTGTGFQEWLTIQNPNDVSADVTIVYLTRGGGETFEELTVGPFSRETVDVNSSVGWNQEVSAIVITDPDTPIIAERPMYFDFNGINGGHDVVGF